MKIKLLLISFVIICLVFLSSCGDSSIGIENIVTSKSGSIDISIYKKEEVDKGKATITPLVSTDDMDITDDGKGLYQINLNKSGEGSVSVSNKKEQAGSLVIIQAIPSSEWKIENYLVDNEVIHSNTFIMPSHDVSVMVVFSNMRHNVNLAGYNDEYYISRVGDYTSAIEGDTCYFSINPHDTYYVEEEDIFVRSLSYDEMGVHKTVDIKKSDDKYFFIMPDYDVEIGWNKKTYGQINGYIVFDDYNQITDNIDNYISFTLTMDNEVINFGEKLKKHTAIIAIDYLNPLYKIDNIEYYYSAYERIFATKQDDNNYSFSVNYGDLYFYLSKITIPENAHMINILDSENGKIECEKMWAENEELVTLKVSPDEGYYVNSIKYTIDNENYEEVFFNGENYIFNMVDQDVNIIATFKKIIDYDNYVKCIVKVATVYNVELSPIEVFSKVIVDDIEIEIDDDLYFYIPKNTAVCFAFYLNENLHILEYEYSDNYDIYPYSEYYEFVGEITAYESDIILKIYIG